jgi:hypothetical protein
MAKSTPTQIPFPLSTAPGSRTQESAGRIINAYAEPLGQGAPSSLVYHRAPGLKAWGTSAGTGFRGAAEFGGFLYAAYSGRLDRYSSAGGASVMWGALSGDAKGFFARNNAATPSLVFCDPDGNVAYTDAGGVLHNGYPDPDLPSVNSVCDLDGYIVFTAANGRAWATDLNALDVNPLSFGTAESKPDGLTRAVSYSGQLFLFGAYSTEIWTDVGTTPFPFARQYVIPRGLAGPYCIAGQENGFGKGLGFVGDDNAVYLLTGVTPNKISPPDLDVLIEAVADKRTLEASVYISHGHAFWQLSCDAWTWTFNLNNGKWHERQSYNQVRSRMSGSVYAFGKWLAGDTLTSRVNEVTASVTTEIGDPLRVRLESGPIENWPAGSHVGRVDFNFTTGVGLLTGADPIEISPVVEISWSDDGGQNFYAARPRSLGAYHASTALVSLISCTGRTSWNGRRWRLDVSDPVHFGFMGGTQSQSARVNGAFVCALLVARVQSCSSHGAPASPDANHGQFPRSSPVWRSSWAALSPALAAWYCGYLWLHTRRTVPLMAPSRRPRFPTTATGSCAEGMNANPSLSTCR